MKNCKLNSSNWRTVFDLEKKERTIKELEIETEKSDFWEDPKRAGKTTRELVNLKEEIKDWQKLKEELEEIKEFQEIAGEDESLKGAIEELERKFKNKEFQLFLSGKYDKGNAVISIYSGAGGQDAQDWSAMLFRMYERYCEKSGFQVKILHQSLGEGGGPEGRLGIKSAILEIKGKYAFGFLKKENGVHRLVRISPFSAQSLRHTSFALVEVLPELSEAQELEIKIKPEDLRVDTFRSSGPGGQNVNRRETAVRLTHLPTGIAVSCQMERAQGQNKAKAMKILLAKLYQLKEEKTKNVLKAIKGEQISASWGNQIRSYVLHPYKLVKDLRTGVETAGVERVLDGDLDEFIAAEIKLAF